MRLRTTYKRGATRKRRASKRRSTVRGGWRLFGRTARVAPFTPSLRRPRSWGNYLRGRPPPPIDFSALSDDVFYGITGAQLDAMSLTELEAYRRNVERRAEGTHREIRQHITTYGGPPSSRKNYSTMTAGELQAISDADIERMDPEELEEYMSAVKLWLPKV